jgi:CubicO group peptidase (beta-lactamase class C family)
MHRMSRWTSRVLLLALATPLLAQAYLDDAVERIRKAFDVPGIAVAVVKDGQVVVAKGYGVRRLGDPAPVTPRTLFGIASNTKIFTAAALAMLVEEGKLAWDDRVVDRLPGFQMSDPYVTREMRIRDLLCHRSGLGLGAGDLMFFPATDLTAADILYRLRFVPLATSFRSEYAYDNILYTVAGAVIQQVSGKPWATFIQERFFAPVGMGSSRTSISDLRPGDDAVAPHALVGDTLKAMAHVPLDNSAPAGAIVSSAEDMARWVLALLAKGDLGNGKRLFSGQQAKVLMTPLTLLPLGEPPAPIAEAKANFAAYAMGLGVSDYRGQLKVSHTGGLQGMVSEVTLLPQQNLGVVVLTNQESGAAFQAITRTVLDHYLGAPPKDWVASYLEVQNLRRAKAKAAVVQAAAVRTAKSSPSLPLAAYAGRYRDPWYGDILVEAKDGQLSIQFTHTPGLRGRLEHWQYDTFVARWNDRSLDADAYLTFSLMPNGKISQARMEAVSPSTDFSFDFQDLVLSPVAAGSPPY